MFNYMIRIHDPAEKTRKKPCSKKYLQELFEKYFKEFNVNDKKIRTSLHTLHFGIPPYKELAWNEAPDSENYTTYESNIIDISMNVSEKEAPLIFKQIINMDDDILTFSEVDDILSNCYKGVTFSENINYVEIDSEY